jgi:hypothetical protein
MVPPNDERAEGGATAGPSSAPSAGSSSTARMDRPSVLRAWRAALDLLNEWEATVLQVRFGVDGGRVRRLPEAARQLGVRPQDLAASEQAALLKLDQAAPTRALAIHLADLREAVDGGTYVPPPPPPRPAQRPPEMRRFEPRPYDSRSQEPRRQDDRAYHSGPPRSFEPRVEPRFVQPPPRSSPPRQGYGGEPFRGPRGPYDRSRPPHAQRPPAPQRPAPPPPPPEPPPRVIPAELAPWAPALLLITERETEVVVLRAGLRSAECPSIAAIARMLGVTRKRAYELHEHALVKLARKPAGAALLRRLQEVANATSEGREVPPLVVPPLPEVPPSPPSLPPQASAPPRSAAPPAALARAVSAPAQRYEKPAPSEPAPDGPEQRVVVRSTSDHDEAVEAVDEALLALRTAAEECRGGTYERLVAPLLELARVVERGANELRAHGPAI